MQKGGLKFLYDCCTIIIWVENISHTNIKEYLLYECKNKESVSTDEITHIMSSLICVICNSVKDSLGESYSKLDCNVRVKNKKTTLNDISAEVSYEIHLKSSSMNFNPILEKPMKILEIKPICMISGTI